jgi:hypothetical protein
MCMEEDVEESNLRIKKEPSHFWDVTRRRLAGGYQCFKTALFVPFQVSRVFLDWFILEGKPIGRPKTSVTNCQPTLCNITKERRPQLERGESPEISHTFRYFPRIFYRGWEKINKPSLWKFDFAQEQECQPLCHDSRSIERNVISYR